MTPAHLEACIPAVPGDAGCAQLRQTYRLCPDHDGWCAPGCPVGAELQQTRVGTPLDGGTTYHHTQPTSRQ
jgi:hypothetical protein